MTTILEEKPYAAVVNETYLDSTCSKCFAWNIVKIQDSPYKDVPGLKRVNLSRCTGCRILYYCGKECQTADWEDHKFECKRFRVCKGIPSNNVRMVSRVLNKERTDPDFKAFNGRTYSSLSDTYQEDMLPKGRMEAMRKFHEEVVHFMGKRAPDLDTVGRTYSKIARHSSFIHFQYTDMNPRSFRIHDGTYCCSGRGTGLYIGLSGHPHNCRSDCFVISNGANLVLRSRDPSGFCLYSPNLSISFNPNRLLRVSEKKKGIKCSCEDCNDKEKDKRDHSGRSECCENGWFVVEDPKCSECGKEVSKERQQMVKEGNFNMGSFLDYRDNLPNATLMDCSSFVHELVEVYGKYKDILTEFNLNFVGFCESMYSQLLTTGHADLIVECMERCMPIMRTMAPSVDLAAFYCQRTLIYYMVTVPAKKRSEAVREAMEMVHIVFGEKHEITESFEHTLAMHKMVVSRRRL